METEMQKHNWEIWVRGTTERGFVDKCVAFICATERGAFLAVEYTADSFPLCRVRLQTDRKARISAVKAVL